jgi:hypothetical protein
MSAPSFTVAAFDAAIESGSWAWPGGYPVYFITSDGAALSYAAAKSESELIRASIAERSRDGWRVTAAAINWEDSDLYCDHTGARIESAYGEESAA